ncbi:DoxX family membrane protein [Leptospira kanakyensis]|uniref:DoxX family membrane protein n=1 Tax=Leptospira kanakyensis TaxID=2484968 RepID=UPI00223DC2AB|nr:DoxX family membrane protein [Leptospira kanakyensis]MCW7467910.1 DoxX family membrane protein [Leptospira kanakyensis]
MNRIDFCFRMLLGIVFILFGSSKFYAFMPTPPMTPGAANFIAALITTGYLWKLVGFFEIGGGILILFPKTTILGILILTPIIVNIIFYLGFLQYQIGPAPFIMILFLVLSSGLVAWHRKNLLIKLFRIE